uniref:Uncharacterized protein n=1 Tax=viral metagenome TaxID=1070528 RepID=A0A6C0IGR5_9ZZZZ
MSQENVSQNHDIKTITFEIMDKYTFIEDYLSSPHCTTLKEMSLLTKLLSTILYLRRRLGFIVDTLEIFCDYETRNDYSNFEQISDKVELYKILVCFVSMALGHVNSTITDDDESRDKIINSIRKYYLQ